MKAIVFEQAWECSATCWGDNPCQFSNDKYSGRCKLTSMGSTCMRGSRSRPTKRVL